MLKGLSEQQHFRAHSEKRFPFLTVKVYHSPKGTDRKTPNRTTSIAGQKFKPMQSGFVWRELEQFSVRLQSPRESWVCVQEPSTSSWGNPEQRILLWLCFSVGLV